MSFQITGFLKMIGPTQQVSEMFRKRDFVIQNVETQYPQFIQFQVTQDRCDLLNDAVLGTEVTVHFNLRGREWTRDGQTKYFNTLEAWKIEKKYVAPQHHQQTPHSIPPVNVYNPDDIGDDLPF